MNGKPWMQAALFLVFLIMSTNCSQDAEPPPESKERTTERKAFPGTLTDSLHIEFRLIKSGTFIMGDDEGLENNRPAHRVTISKPFYISVKEITQAQYELIMGENPSEVLGQGLPVTHITWHDAVEFCERLSRKEGVLYSLPTEAEWEYAYRAGTTTQYYWGDDFDETALSQPNPWGLINMAGSVREWCLDWYAPYLGEELTDPFVSERTEKLKVIRGGNVSSDAVPVVFTHYYRDGADPDTSLHENIGFRVIRIAH